MTTILDESAGRLQIAPLTVEQYEAMIAQGILPEGEPIELIDGLLVLKDRASAGGDPLTIGPHHQLVLNKLTRLGPRFEARGCYLSIQGPIRIPPQDEPEPDVAVIAGRPEDFSDGHPGPQSVHAVIEVADSSLLRDRTTKLRIYAGAGIQQYVIVNLVDRQVEVHEEPVPGEQRYARSSVRTGQQLVAIAAGGAQEFEEIAAKDLLPGS